MKRTSIIGLFAFILFSVSCVNNGIIDDTTIDGKVRKTFVNWSKDNLNTKHKIQSITYDTVGCPMEYMLWATTMGQTVGSSGHAESELNMGLNLLGLESVLDSSFLTTNIYIANLRIQTDDSICMYYIGIRGDSVCTAPQKHGYEALLKTHHDGEQHLYDACYEIFCNLGAFAQEKGGGNIEISNEDFYSFWINILSHKEALGK